MKTYVFENPGVIDPRSITTFGVSSKENEGAIGFFGTGLKYAIAVLLRLGCQISIISGGKTYRFGVETGHVRVNKFDFVTMNGVPLGFTTELGKTWEVWQAFRELACNAMDERGKWYEYDSSAGYVPDSTKTYVLVTGAKFSEAWAERDSIMLPMNKMEAVAGNADITAYAGHSDYIYYRGVRVMKLRRPSLYTYNVKAMMQLTEDRTFAFPWMVDYTVQGMVAKSNVVPFLRDVLIADPMKYWEGNALNFASISLTSPEFSQVVMEYARTFHPMLNASACKLVTDNNIADFVKDEALDLDAVDKERLRRANEFLLKMGYPVTDYPIVITSHLGSDVLGRAHDGTIYISKRCLMMGTKMLAGTILEEYIHIKHGYTDCTRSMQNFLFDALISAGERVTGMPL